MHRFSVKGNATKKDISMLIDHPALQAAGNSNLINITLIAGEITYE